MIVVSCTTSELCSVHYGTLEETFIDLSLIGVLMSFYCFINDMFSWKQ